MIPIGEDRRSPIFPVVVFSLIAANLAVFAREATVPNADAFIDAFALVPYNVTHGIVLAPPSPPFPALTILTAMFLHASVLHIAANLLFLFVFGPTIEALFGHARFLTFYLACGIAGGVAQIAAGPGSHVPEIGASGAIAGVLGAYIVRYPTATVDTILPIGCFPLFLRLPALVVIGAWAAVQFVNGFGTLSTHVGVPAGGIAYFAHIGGFSCGVFLVELLRMRTPGARRLK